MYVLYQAIGGRRTPRMVSPLDKLWSGDAGYGQMEEDGIFTGTFIFPDVFL